MTYILLFVAVNTPPAQLGTYHSEASCQQAIRGIYEQRFPDQLRKTPKIQQVIDITVKYQLEYRCQPQ